MSRIIRVLCVDDHPEITALCRQLIDVEPDLTVVGTLDSADALVSEAKELLADVVLLDLTMPGKSPIEAIRELAEARPEARVIVFTAHDDRALLDPAVDAGAWGSVSKDAGFPSILNAIRRVAAGESVG